MPTTRTNLDLQSDLKAPAPPVAGDDVVNKDYVDTAISSIPVATSAPGGGTIGRATFDESFGLEAVAGAARVRVDGSTIQFNGGGQLEALPGAVPTATAAPGGGTLGRASFDTDLGLDATAGVARVKVDGAAVQFNGGGQLTVPDGTAAPGGGVKGKFSLDSDLGLDATSGVARVKVDGASVQFNLSGELEVVGAGGGTTGSVSYEAPFTRNIPAVTAITPGVVGTDISSARYLKSAGTSGERFEFTVGDDYFSGNLEIILVYRMMSAEAAPNNQVRLSTQAQIVDPVTGSLDLASYPDTPSNVLVPDNSTDWTRQTVLTIADGDFQRGSHISVAIKRIAGDVLDLHPGDLEVVAYTWRYTAIVDSRVVVQTADFFSNAVGENPALPVVIGTLIDAVNLESAADSAVKFTFLVTDNWDTAADAIVYLTFLMSSAVAGTVRIETYGEIVNVQTGSVVAIPPEDFDFSPDVSTSPQQRIVRAVPRSLLSKGSYVTIVAARRTAVGGNHTGDLYLTAARAALTTAPVTGFAAVTVTEEFLHGPVYGNVVGTITTDPDYPDFAGDFETLFRAASSSAAGRVDAAFEGRLSFNQTTVEEIKVGFKLGAGASPSYVLKVYADGFGAVPVYDSGAPVAAPAGYTEVTVTSGMLSNQPAGTGRFFVVVEAYVDAGEALLFSRPFVRQE